MPRRGKEPEPRPQPIEIFVTREQAEELYNFSNNAARVNAAKIKAIIDLLPSPSMFWQDVSNTLNAMANEYHLWLGLISVRLVSGEEIQVQHNPNAQKPNSYYKGPFLFHSSSSNFIIGMSEMSFSHLLEFISKGRQSNISTDTLSRIKAGQTAIIKTAQQTQI